MTRRLSDALTERDAEAVAASLRKYGYRGPARVPELARWLRAKGEEFDTPAPAPPTGQRERRPHQAAFRRAVLAAYDGRCAITGCDAEDALEAAHVADWRVENDAGAGILLRADLHRLFERGLLVIDAECRVAEAPAWYAELVGRRLRLPANLCDRPRLAPGAPPGNDGSREPGEGLPRADPGRPRLGGAAKTPS